MSSDLFVDQLSFTANKHTKSFWNFQISWKEQNFDGQMACLHQSHSFQLESSPLLTSHCSFTSRLEPYFSHKWTGCISIALAPLPRLVWSEMQDSARVSKLHFLCQEPYWCLGGLLGGSSSLGLSTHLPSCHILSTPWRVGWYCVCCLSFPRLPLVLLFRCTGGSLGCSLSPYVVAAGFTCVFILSGPCNTGSAKSKMTSQSPNSCILHYFFCGGRFHICPQIETIAIDSFC